ncbi:MAG TPA: two-component regulator propeller domain-containing protein, partial [Cyclobacteriaceae bacterium]|nr:two-component regulator propeller domain-containing protein [Cyclobacteriaceae bacterium]
MVKGARPFSVYLNFRQVASGIKHMSLDMDSLREDNLWVGTALGLARLREEAVVTFGRTQGLRSDRVLAVAEGKNRHIWAGTDNGLNKITGGRVTAFKAQELSGAWVYDILPAPDGGLWLATRQGLIRARDDGLAGVRLADGQPVIPGP